jgi:predicted dehydrogenase
MTSTRRATACIVGTGFIGPAHIEALRRLGVPVAGLVERDAATAEAKAKELGVARGYPSLEAALADPGIDAVHLAVPNHLHAPCAKAALAAGKHVLCEKPLALTSAESAELAALARSSGRVAAVNYNLRFYPLVREARELVRAGRLGRTFMAHGVYLQDWLLYDTDWSWHLEPREGGILRVVADVGTHWLDMVSFITGLRVEAVMADLATFHPVRQKPLGPVETFAGTGRKRPASGTEPVPITSEDAASILLRFEGGAIGTLLVSQSSAGRKNALRFEIAGSEAALAWDSEAPNHLWLGQRSEPNRIILKDPSLLSPAAAAISGFPGGHQEGYGDTLKQLFKRFYQYYRGRRHGRAARFPHLRGRPHRDAALRRPPAERPHRRLGGRSARIGPRAWAGRCRACQARAAWTGAASWPRCTGRGTTGRCRWSTRTRISRGARRRWSGAS